ncbi:hypothetical protein KCU93_g5618, partial [Aureobasidium melanogenum]
MAVSSPAAQDVVFRARVDELKRRERERFKLSPVLPRFKPDTPSPEYITERAVMQHSMRKWPADERVLYLTNLDAPLVPSTTKQRVPKPVYDAVYLDQTLEESLGGESIADKLLIMTVEDEDLDDTGWHGALSYHGDFCADDMVPPGLDTGMILVADAQAVRSLLQLTHGVEPWIWAVDVDHDWKIENQPSLGSSPVRQYPGFIRVALSVVLSDFWPLLKISGVVGRHLWTPDLGLWEGIGV